MDGAMTDYTALYEIIRPGVQASAIAMWPHIDRVYENITGRHPKSVLDVGCGEGWWGRIGVEEGYVDRATGIDGPWGGRAIADAEDTDNNPDFMSLDFSEMNLDFFRPPVDTLGNKYDIALCLEVAEHLDNPDPLIRWLTKCADVVVFSAAIPGQPGSGHVSCRWQAQWAEAFEAVDDWVTDDSLRPAIWYDHDIEFWYRQNVFVAYTLPHAERTTHREVLSMVHPEMWAVRHDCR
jgi:SAM-dependent methyltransferase